MLQLALAIWGIYVLYTGKLKVTSNKQVTGTPARLLGGFMLAPLPVGFMLGIAVGIWAGANGKDVSDIQMPLLAVDVALVLGTALGVIGIAHAIGKPPGDIQQPPHWTYQPPSPSAPSDPNNPYHPPQV
jgi:hypothetical protein